MLYTGLVDVDFLPQAAGRPQGLPGVAAVAALVTVRLLLS
jgi:hypothetical protein